MSEILSQDEVDALLKGMKEGEVDTEPQAAPEGIHPYDLTSQERIIRGRMPGLESINERFARLLRVSMSNFMSKFIDVSVQGVTLMKFGEFMRNVPLPSSINMFRIHPLKGFALLILEAPLVFTIVEYFFGGSNTSFVKAEGRSFTAVEQRLINKVLSIALEELQNAWEGILKVKTELAGSETNPQFVNIITPTDVIIKVEFHIEMETFTGKLFLGIPYSLIEPIKEKLYSGITSDSVNVDNRWVSKLIDLLNASYVNTTVEIDTTELRVEEILKLQVGDVITLGKSVGDEFVVKIEGVPKFYCQPGIHKGSQAVRITRPVENRTGPAETLMNEKEGED